MLQDDNWREFIADHAQALPMASPFPAAFSAVSIQSLPAAQALYERYEGLRDMQKVRERIGPREMQYCKLDRFALGSSTICRLTALTLRSDYSCLRERSRFPQKLVPDWLISAMRSRHFPILCNHRANPLEQPLRWLEIAQDEQFRGP